MNERAIPSDENSELHAEIARLNKVINVLMDRAEREMGGSGSDFNMFQNTLTLEKQVQERTRALEAAVQENQRINRALQREKEAQEVLIRRLETTQAQLLQSEKLASLGALVAGIAHELNTPIGNGVMAISTLRSALDTFRQAIADGVRRSALETLLAATDTGSDITLRNLQRAAELITSFKQVAADQTSSQRRQFELDQTIDQILQSIKPSLKNTLAKICADIPPGIVMDSYPGPLVQVISNLVGNAAMHAFEGRVPDEVRIDARLLDKQTVCIRVLDNGVGIPSALLPRIFDPFVTTKMGRGGTGLGLAIVHNIVVQVLGGNITVMSDEGHGTTFNIAIPLVAPLSQGEETSSSRAAPQR